MPLGALAAVLFVVAYNMSEWREIGGIFRAELADITVWLVTFALTVMADLTIAVEVGMALAALLYIYRVSETTTVSAVTPKYIDEGRPHILQDKSVPDYVSISAHPRAFPFRHHRQARRTKRLTFRIAPPSSSCACGNMTAIDATGLRALEDLADRLQRSGRSLILCSACDQPRRIMNEEEFIGHIGAKSGGQRSGRAAARAGDSRRIFGPWGGSRSRPRTRRPLIAEISFNRVMPRRASPMKAVLLAICLLLTATSFSQTTLAGTLRRITDDKVVIQTDKSALTVVLSITTKYYKGSPSGAMIRSADFQPGDRIGIHRHAGCAGRLPRPERQPDQSGYARRARRSIQIRRC